MRIKHLRILAVILALLTLCGCAAKNPGALVPDAVETAAPAAVTSVPTEAPTAEPEPTPAVTEPAETPEPEKEPERFVFRPKVTASYYEEVFGSEMCEVWSNLVDAVMAGETSFACPDKTTCDWVMGQFPYRCFPVLEELIAPWPDPEKRCVDGVAYFEYTMPYEEVSAKIDEFAGLVEGMLNEAMTPSDSDFEKALDLYLYFDKNFVYNWDQYDSLYSDHPEEISPLECLRTKKGICQALSVAYSYLLMQAGVDATVMSGHRASDKSGHQWSYVKIGGHDYHVDPTYVLGTGSLSYFLMTDEQREAMDGYMRNDYTIASNYAQDHPHPDYAADDETFKPLWNSEITEYDRKNRVLHIIEHREDGTTVRRQFKYGGY